MVDASSSPAVRAAERYVEVATGGGKGRLADLFAPDAEFHHPEGGVINGRETIRAFYDRRLANLTPTFHIPRMAKAGDECWVELAYGDPSAPDLVSANHFTVGPDGLITRLAVFLRPRAS
jgi:hypothetical protein